MKLATCLWFDSQAEQAAQFYVSVFKNSKIVSRTHYTEEGFEIHQRPAGSLATIVFELDGRSFTGLNGGPLFKFSEAVSIVVECKDQAEIDLYWEKLTAGGNKDSQVCGWLKDKFGLSWQIVPENMERFYNDPDKKKVNRAWAAMMRSKKLNIAELEKAFEGKA